MDRISTNRQTLFRAVSPRRREGQVYQATYPRVELQEEERGRACPSPCQGVLSSSYRHARRWRRSPRVQVGVARRIARPSRLDCPNVPTLRGLDVCDQILVSHRARTRCNGPKEAAIGAETRTDRTSRHFEKGIAYY